MHLPYWIKGGILGIAYVFIIFFIKTTCTPDWCFADVFLPFTFGPLLVFDYLLSDQQIIVLGRNLIKTTLATWFVIGASLGLLYGFWKKRKESK